jgi:thermostable 8-oxoguanine DNA glycosylase
MANGGPVTSAAGPAPLPGWLGPIVTITTQLGVPTVVAAVLLWFVLTRIDTALQKIQVQEDLRTQFVADMQRDLIATLEKQTVAFQAAIAENIAVNKEHATDLHRLLSTPPGRTR